jgi:hypothetical protein
MEDGALLLALLVREVNGDAGVANDAGGDLGGQTAAHGEDLGEGLAVGVLDGHGEPAIGLVESQRGLDVWVVQGVDGAGDLTP